MLFTKLVFKFRLAFMISKIITNCQPNFGFSAAYLRVLHTTIHSMDSKCWYQETLFSATGLN